jgi:hypothetical protein
MEIIWANKQGNGDCLATAISINILHYIIYATPSQIQLSMST